MTDKGSTLIETVFAQAVGALVMVFLSQSVCAYFDQSAEALALKAAATDLDAVLAHIQQDHRYRSGNPVLSGGELQITRSRRTGNSVNSGLVRRSIVCRPDRYGVGSLPNFPAACPRSCPSGQTLVLEVIDDRGALTAIPNFVGARHDGTAAFGLCFALTPVALTVTGEAAIVGNDNRPLRVARAISLSLNPIQGSDVQVVP